MLDDMKLLTLQNRAFLIRLLADYNRFVLEAIIDSQYKEERKQLHERTIELYQMSERITKQNSLFSKVDATKLSIALNFSKFCYEYIEPGNDSGESQTQAIVLATEALNDVIDGMDEATEATFNECKPIIALLKVNLQKWQKEKDKDMEVEL